MSPLSHAAAHERLTDLALEPAELAGLGSPASDPLAAHIATCDLCRGEVEAWRRTTAAIEAAKGTGPERVDLADLAGDAPIPAPPELRAIVAAVPAHLPVPASSPTAEPASPAAAAVADQPGPLGPAASTRAGTVVVPPREPRSRRLGRLILPLVAVLAVVAVGGGLLLDQSRRLDESGNQVALLEGMTASLDRILQDPEHTTLELRTADGASAGTLAWSRRDLVVLTTVLDAPPADRVFRCWIERDGKRSPVGLLWFAGETAFWNGALDEWATISLDAGGTFGVSLEPITAPEGNPAVLSAELGG